MKIEIESKYSLGDEVYLINPESGRPVKGRIEEINVVIQEGKREVCYSVRIPDGTLFIRVKDEYLESVLEALFKKWAGDLIEQDEH